MLSTVPTGPGVGWSGCDKEGVDLRGAFLTNADLSSAYLCNVDLSGANLSTVYPEGAQCDPLTTWTGGTQGHERECPSAS